MAKSTTYIKSRHKCNTTLDTSNLVTKEEFVNSIQETKSYADNEITEAIQEAKNYTDEEIKKLNNIENHSHANKSVLDKLTESNGDLFFNGKNLSGVIFETIEG